MRLRLSDLLESWCGGWKKYFHRRPKPLSAALLITHLHVLWTLIFAFFYISSPPWFFVFCTDITLRRVQTNKLSFKNNNCPYGALKADTNLPYSIHTTPDDISKLPRIKKKWKGNLLFVHLASQTSNEAQCTSQLRQMHAWRGIALLNPKTSLLWHILSLLISQRFHRCLKTDNHSLSQDINLFPYTLASQKPAQRCQYSD
jgi:hypothetical protein